MRFFLCLLCVSGVRLWAQNLEVVSGKTKTTLSLRQMKAKLKTTTLKIQDPVYNKSKEFDAFLLRDVLQLAGVNADKNADELVFTALDGYSPNVSFAELLKHKAYVAYQEHSTPGRFASITQGKMALSPGPFYVIWDEGIKLKDQVPWAYQLVKMEVVDWAQKYPLVVPQKASVTETKGFALFKSECIRCHSINLQGGDLGPELNAPQSVTEYWKPDVLKAFIHNVGAFRFKSKMPVFTRLSDEELNQLIAYLTKMKDFKIETP